MHALTVVGYKDVVRAIYQATLLILIQSTNEVAIEVPVEQVLMSELLEETGSVVTVGDTQA